MFILNSDLAVCSAFVIALLYVMSLWVNWAASNIDLIGGVGVGVGVGLGVGVGVGLVGVGVGVGVGMGMGVGKYIIWM